LWERLFGLPEQPDVSESRRVATVIAQVRSRRAGYGYEWVDAVTTLLGSGDWTYEEIAPFQINVTIPFDPTGYTAGQAARLLRRITPANLLLGAGYTGGFILGVSTLGETF
jgi:hypothetical protein